jgi:hypothetical protein
VHGHKDAKDNIIRLIAQWISNPESKGLVIGIQGAPGTGKCLAIDTPVLMHDGSTKLVQNIEIGDILMGDDQTPRRVLRLGKGKSLMYKVSAIDGRWEYVANGDHIMCLKDDLGRVQEISIDEYLALNDYKKGMLQGYSLDGGINSACKRDKARRELVDILQASGEKDMSVPITFRNDNAATVERVAFLARSLGMLVNKEQNGKCACIFGGTTNMPTTPISVTCVGEGDYYGFTIDGNGRFVLGNFAVTHNTSLVKDGICKALGLPFAFVALGGATDGSYLDGHSYT